MERLPRAHRKNSSSRNNPNILKDLKIKIENDNYENKTIYDYENTFPNEFSISFNKFKKHFYIEFFKIPKTDPSYPYQNPDVYVMDKKTGSPIKHSMQTTDEVSFVFHLF